MELKVCLLGTPGFLKENAHILQRTSLKIGAQATDADSAIQYANDLVLDLIIVDEDVAGGGLEAGGRCAKALNGIIPVFLATRSPGIQINRDAQLKGMNGCVKKPLYPDQVQSMMQKIREEEAAFAPEPQRQSFRDFARELRAAPIDDDSPRAVYSKQEVVMIYSSKGGVGKSTLAANLAAYIAYRSPRTRTVLVDFDVRSRVAHLISVTERPNLRDWVGDEPYDRQSVESKLVRHACGLWVLPGIDRAIYQEEFTRVLAGSVLNTLKRFFDVIIIDCGPDYRDSTLTALEHATTVFMVATLDIATLFDIQQTQEDFEDLSLDSSKVKLVLNRVTPKPSLPIAQVAQKLAYPLVAKLPEEPMVPLMANEGSLFALARPDAPFTAELAKLARQVAAVDQDKPKRRGLFSFFRRRGGKGRDSA
jgi:pilus assembly protein CpaE